MMRRIDRAVRYFYSLVIGHDYFPEDLDFAAHLREATKKPDGEPDYLVLGRKRAISLLGSKHILHPSHQIVRDPPPEPQRYPFLLDKWRRQNDDPRLREFARDHVEVKVAKIGRLRGI